MLDPKIEKLVQPWNKILTATQVRVLQQFVADNGVDLHGLRVEGLRTAARLICRRPNLGHEEVHHFALATQEERERKNPEVCVYKTTYHEKFVQWT